jgi:DNA-binding GntR family transcriptional regulator
MIDKLDGHKPLVPQLFNALRTAIITLQLTPGQSISEKEVATQIGVSRQPVREAFIKLADAQLLDIQPQRGTFVVKISIRAVMDARFIREALEAAVVKELIGQVDARFFNQIDYIMEQQHAAADIEDWGGFLQWDDRFHRAFTEASGRECVWRIIEREKAQMDRVRYLRCSHSPISNLIDQHLLILDAIKKGDAAAAQESVRYHMTEILSLLPSIAKANADLFEDTYSLEMK